MFTLTLEYTLNFIESCIEGIASDKLDVLVNSLFLLSRDTPDEIADIFKHHLEQMNTQLLSYSRSLESGSFFLIKF